MASISSPSSPSSSNSLLLCPCPHPFPRPQPLHGGSPRRVTQARPATALATHAAVSAARGTAAAPRSPLPVRPVPHIDPNSRVLAARTRPSNVCGAGGREARGGLHLRSIPYACTQHCAFSRRSKFTSDFLVWRVPPAIRACRYVPHIHRCAPRRCPSTSASTSTHASEPNALPSSSAPPRRRRLAAPPRSAPPSYRRSGDRWLVMSARTRNRPKNPIMAIRVKSRYSLPLLNATLSLLVPRRPPSRSTTSHSVALSWTGCAAVQTSKALAKREKNAGENSGERLYRLGTVCARPHRGVFGAF